MTAEPAAPEFSRPIAVDRIGTAWRTVALTASDAERAALAARFGLVELPALGAEVKLRRARAGRYVEIAGTLRAAVVQTCVVTLEPVPAALEEDFSLLLGPIGGADDDAPASDLVVDLDQPEPLEGDVVDLGELVAQQLSLALDPYPRAPDAPPPEAVGEGLGAGGNDGGDPAGGQGGGAPRPDSPFAVLLARDAGAPKSKPKAK
jgi:hypothetical protein